MYMGRFECWYGRFSLTSSHRMPAGAQLRDLNSGPSGQKRKQLQALAPRMCHTVAYCNIFNLGRASVSMFVSMKRCFAINYKYIIEYSYRIRSISNRFSSLRTSGTVSVAESLTSCFQLYMMHNILPNRYHSQPRLCF